jgi:hypothetical protein
LGLRHLYLYLILTMKYIQTSKCSTAFLNYNCSTDSLSSPSVFKHSILCCKIYIKTLQTGTCIQYVYPF